MFRDGWTQEAQRFAPQSIAGTLAQIESLAALRIPSLTHAVIVLQSPGQPLLTDPIRDQLWSAFRLPIFEQIIGDDGVLLAAECEAHDGLHIESSRFRPDGIIETSRCGCGRTTPRLIPEEAPAPLERVASFAD